MHSLSWDALEDGDESIEKGDCFSFHYNSDLSGEVFITQQRYKDAPTGTIPSILNEIVVPAWMLLEFVGQHISSDLIAKLENMSGTETLKFLQGV